MMKNIYSLLQLFFVVYIRWFES